MPASDDVDLWARVRELEATVVQLVDLQERLLATLDHEDHQEGQAPGSSLQSIRDELGELRNSVPGLGAESAASPGSHVARFVEIAVERINVIEEDGSLRLVISNKSRAPDGIIDGRVLKRMHPNPAGLIFYNEEGDECGGLVFSGMSREEHVDADAGILFDQFKQDQTVGLMYTDKEGQRSAGLYVWDRTGIPLSELVDRYTAIQHMLEGPDKTRALEENLSPEVWGAQRVFVGSNPDRQAIVSLHDMENRPRLRLVVAADGEATIELLDAEGGVTYRFPPTATSWRSTAPTSRRD